MRYAPDPRTRRRAPAHAGARRDDRREAGGEAASQGVRDHESALSSQVSRSSAANQSAKVSASRPVQRARTRPGPEGRGRRRGDARRGRATTGAQYDPAALDPAMQENERWAVTSRRARRSTRRPRRAVAPSGPAASTSRSRASRSSMRREDARGRRRGASVRRPSSATGLLGCLADRVVAPAARLRRSSLERMLATWCSAVRRLMYEALAYLRVRASRGKEREDLRLALGQRPVALGPGAAWRPDSLEQRRPLRRRRGPRPAARTS